MGATVTLKISAMIGVMAILFLHASQRSEEEALLREEFSSIPSQMPLVNLGVIELAPGIPKEFDLERGRAISIKATEVANQNLEVTLEYQLTRASFPGAVTRGRIEKSTLLLRPGMRCAPKLGDDLAVVIGPILLESAEGEVPRVASEK